MNKQINEGNIQELKICRRGPRISHLLFDHDGLLFFKVKSDKARHMKNVITTYEKSTCQLLNPINLLFYWVRMWLRMRGLLWHPLNVRNTSFREIPRPPSAREQNEGWQIPTHKRKTNCKMFRLDWKIFFWGNKRGSNKSCGSSHPHTCYEHL
jgi:hypothetical protein